jgi:hypothetical protein
MMIMGELRVSFPSWSRRKLEREAVAHADDVALERGVMPGDAPVDRLVVTMLRDEFTSFDATQTARVHRAAGEAVADRYPWLRPECGRQIRLRELAERDEAGWVAAAVEQEQAATRWRLDRVESPGPRSVRCGWVWRSPPP